MKIAYIGNFEPEYSTENDVRKAFEFLGHELIQLQENKTSIQELKNIALMSDLLLVTGTWDSIPLGDMLDLYHDCAASGIPTATIHLDTFWPTVREGRKWWREAMFHTAYIFTADGDFQNEWKLFGKNHIWLPPAVRHDAAHFGTPRPEYQCDVAFVGSNGQGYHEDVWGYRKQLVDQLRYMCSRNGWVFKNPGGDEAKIDRGNDMNDFYASAKVTVGDSLCLKKEHSHYWSDRVPEATGRGGFLIMPQIDALEAYWGLGNIPTYKWGDYEGLEGQIRWFLSHAPERQQLVSTTQKITATDHTYVNRAQTILETVGLGE